MPRLMSAPWRTFFALKLGLCMLAVAEPVVSVAELQLRMMHVLMPFAACFL